jgi:L-threonylcarbamoyladenylate synthase
VRPGAGSAAPWRIRPAVAVLGFGGVIAYPTEGVYGLGCDPFDEAAVARVLRIKRRSSRKGLILVAADLAQVEALIAPLNTAAWDRLRAATPGPVTWVVPARTAVPHWLTHRRGTLAVRVSAHPITVALSRAFGRPMVSTSANRAGRDPARTATEVRWAFGADVDLVLSGPLGGAPGPSEIRDLLSGRRLRPAATGASV